MCATEVLFVPASKILVESYREHKFWKIYSFVTILVLFRGGRRGAFCFINNTNGDHE